MWSDIADQRPFDPHPTPRQGQKGSTGEGSENPGLTLGAA